jgi:hypothetical protein
MTAGAYDDDIAAAREAIEEDGQVCQWVKQVTTLTDEAAPWLGGATEETSNDVPIVFVPANASGSTFGLTKYRGAIEAGDFDTFGLMAPPVGFVPELGDKVLRDGAPLVLVTLDALRPAQDVVLYILGIK